MTQSHLPFLVAPARALRVLVLTVGLGMGIGASAWAEVWGYVDERGVAHFASERLDDRYELYFRGNGKGELRAPTENTPRPVAVPTAPPKLLAFFEVSNAFKQARPHMREAAQAHRVDFELLQAIIATESGFDPRAVSPRGAVGLMQVMPATAQEWGVKPDARVAVQDKLMDPQTNIQTGTRYLRHLLDRFSGQLDLALAAYNAGMGAVQRAGHRIPAIKETQDYVRTVKQLYEMLKPPATLAQARAPQRPVGPELHAQPGLRGGAMGRSNMPSSLQAAAEPMPKLPLVSAAPAEWRIERPGSEEVIR